MLVDRPLESLTNARIEPSKASPNSRVLVLQFDDESLRLHGARKGVTRMAVALSRLTGLQIEEEESDGLFIVKALPCGVLYCLGALVLLAGLVSLLSEPWVDATLLTTIGAAMIWAGEALRRRLFA